MHFKSLESLVPKLDFDDMETTSERLLRDVFAALLGSRIKKSDLRRLSELLRFDREFAEYLGFALDRYLGSVETRAEQEWPIAPAEEVLSGGVSGLIYQIVQRRRLSKAEFIRIAAELTSKRDWERRSPDVPMKELVEQFVKGSSNEQIRDLLSRLGVEIEEDAYLSGITSRDRR
jgi:hypothetical protein